MTGQTKRQSVKSGVVDRFLRWLVRNIPSDAHSEREMRLGLFQGWSSVVVNGTIFLLKLALGLFLGSIALIADSVDSVFDVVGGAIIIVSTKWARKPRDAEHPFGHGRIDQIAGLVMGVLLAVVSFELIRASVARIWHPVSYTAPWWLIGVVVATIPAKEWLAQVALAVSRETGGATHEAGYWYQRFDSLTTSIVCLGLITSRYGWPAVDGWIGLLIALWIGWTGVRLAKETVSPLLGEAATPEEVSAVADAAVSQSGVRGVHGVLMHKYGDTRLVSLHIEVDARKTAEESHDIAERVEQEVERRTQCRAIVHVDPIDLKHPLYGRVEEEIRKVVISEQGVLGFHDLRVKGEDEQFDVSLDFVVDMNFPPSAESRIERLAMDALRRVLPRVRDVKIVFERSYTERAAT